MLLDEVKAISKGTAAKAAFLPKCPNKLKLSLLGFTIH
jgi:hypothetical protein